MHSGEVLVVTVAKCGVWAGRGHTCWMHIISWPTNTPSDSADVAGFSSPLSVCLSDLYCTYLSAQSGWIAAISFLPNFMSAQPWGGSGVCTCCVARAAWQVRPGRAGLAAESAPLRERLI